MTQAIQGKHLLLVEDDELVALTVEDILLHVGAASVTVAGSVPVALEALEQRNFDVAIVDINLNGHASWPVAERLRATGIPYLSVTGYGDMVEHDLIQSLLPKPYSMDQLLKSVSTLLA